MARKRNSDERTPYAGRLVYIGNAFLPDIPARDLSAAEVARYGGAEALLASGLYAMPQGEETDAHDHGLYLIPESATVVPPAEAAADERSEGDGDGA